MSHIEMLDQIQETQDKHKPRNIRKLNPYPRQEQVINPKNLGNPGNTQVIYFLGWGGLPKKEITWVLPGLPKYLGLITCSCLGYGFRLE